MEQKVLDYIAKDVQVQCNRLGINAEFSLETRKDYRNEDYMVIKSTDFQMMPMIFHDIHVEGVVTIEPCAKNDKYDDCIIRLGYKWNHFDGGSNGCEIGTVHYRINRELSSVVGDDDVRLAVQKVTGIQL